MRGDQDRRGHAIAVDSGEGLPSVEFPDEYGRGAHQEQTDRRVRASVVEGSRDEVRA